MGYSEEKIDLYYERLTKIEDDERAETKKLQEFLAETIRYCEQLEYLLSFKNRTPQKKTMLWPPDDGY